MLSVALFTVGSASLSFITLIRLLAIAFNRPMIVHLKEGWVYAIVVGIWAFSLGVAFPSLGYRRWWYR